MKINDFSDKKKMKGGSKGPIGQTAGGFGKPVAVSTVGPDPSKNKGGAGSAKGKKGKKGK